MALTSHRIAFLAFLLAITVFANESYAQNNQPEEAYQDIPFDSVWVIKTLAKNRLPRGIEPSIRFNFDGEFKGFTGCNEIYGRYIRQNDQLKFGDLNLGRKKCGLRIMSVERRFLSALTRTYRATHKPKNLRVFDDDGREIATLERAG